MAWEENSRICLHMQLIAIIFRTGVISYKIRIFWVTKSGKKSELKQVYGYDKALSYGIDSMQMQGAMVIFAANIKRILRLS